MADSQRKTANLFDFDTMSSGVLGNYIRSDGTLQAQGGWNTSDYVPCNGNIFTLTVPVGGVSPAICLYDGDKNYITGLSYNGNSVIIVQSEIAASYIRFSVRTSWTKSEIMLNEGSTALPYEPYGWLHSLRKLTTAAEAVENPLYSDGTAITSYTIKGNSIQAGTPTPSNPIPVEGVGEFDSGQYKIPILNGQQTTNIHLGSTQTVRQIKKLVLTGEENWGGSNGAFYLISVTPDYMRGQDLVLAICSHYSSSPQVVAVTSVPDKSISFSYSPAVQRFYLADASYTNTTELKTYLQQQYANGTPVTVWYVLATPETAAVNEPLMKIGNYADTLSNATAIPTTEGANSITVDTTVQPSEFTATWTGWHDSSVKEWDGSDWQ